MAESIGNRASAASAVRVFQLIEKRPGDHAGVAESGGCAFRAPLRQRQFAATTVFVPLTSPAVAASSAAACEAEGKGLSSL